MAAGSVVFYMEGLKAIFNGDLDLDSASLVVSLVSEGYTPNAKSHSAFSTNVASSIVTAAGYADKTLASVSIAITSGSYVTWDADDATISATETMKAKWAVITANKGSAAEKLVAYFDTETTQTTGVEVTQLVVQWNALGIAQLNNPSA